MTPYKTNPLLTRRGFLLASAGAAGATLIATALTPSNALATTWSTPISASRNGVTYTYSSGIDSTGKIIATTRIMASKAIPAGTMKAKAILLKSLNNNIVASSGVKKNAMGSTLTVTTSLNSLAAGYRSRGSVWYNGSGWKRCNIASMGRSLPPELPTNENGQTLGTYDDTERGSAPDLVGIVADSGLDGYAYWDQFDAEDCPESIPVYAEDGTTQIGVFTFGDK